MEPPVRREDRGVPGAGAAALVCALLASCGGGGSGEGAAPGACPGRFSADPGREARVVERLGAAGEGRAVLARWGRPLRMCFGEVPSSVVTEQGTLLMDARLDDARAAARAAHLAAHLADGLPALVGGEGGCDARVREALRAEARALALELRLVRALGAPPPEGGPWEVEAVHWAAPPEGREAAIEAYLRSHPDGAPGVDALAAGYARRCAEAKGR